LETDDLKRKGLAFRGCPVDQLAGQRSGPSPPHDAPRQTLIRLLVSPKLLTKELLGKVFTRSAGVSAR